MRNHGLTIAAQKSIVGEGGTVELTFHFHTLFDEPHANPEIIGITGNLYPPAAEVLQNEVEIIQQEVLFLGENEYMFRLLCKPFDLVENDEFVVGLSDGMYVDWEKVDTPEVSIKCGDCTFALHYEDFYFERAEYMDIPMKI